MGKQKQILLIYTGGTIGMVLNKENTYSPFNFEHTLSQFPEINRFDCKVDVFSFKSPIDSSNVVPRILVKLARIIGDNYEKYDGFVILHGSDTMAYTGSALSFMLEGLQKPVIMTGAQLPIGEVRTDAKENLIAAIEIASHPETPVKEVCIYFEYKLYRANRTKKMHADVFHAFNSPNFRPIAQAGVSIRYYRHTPPDAYEKLTFRVHDQLESNIATIKFFPGISPEMVNLILLHDSLKGVIIESYGAGNLPTDPAIIDSIEASIAKGKTVLNITQCSGGTVDMGRYETSKLLADHGVLSGYDLTYEAAVTKMMYLMGKYDDLEKVKYYLVRNIRGEMTAERAYTL